MGDRSRGVLQQAFPLAYGSAGSSGEFPGLPLSRSPSAASLFSRFSGDSEMSGVPADNDEENSGEPQSRQPRDTQPILPAVAKPQLRSAILNDRADVGNIGVFFGNWGLRASSAAVQRNIDLQIRRGPAQIIVLTECQEATERVLNETAVADDPQEARSAVADAASPLATRDGFQYMKVRGNEASSVLIGARTRNARSLELILWMRREEGEYKCKTKTKAAHSRKAIAHSRILIVRVNLIHQVGHIGNTIVVMGVHFHCLPAKKEQGFRRQNDEF